MLRLHWSARIAQDVDGWLIIFSKFSCVKQKNNWDFIILMVKYVILDQDNLDDGL